MKFRGSLTRKLILVGGLSAFAAGAHSAAPLQSPAAFDLANAVPILVLQAVGAQVYQCISDATSGQASWHFREPIATLMQDGKTVGRHYAGPSWALDDGSQVSGKLAASAPGATADDVPLLKLQATAHRGEGALTAASWILRLDTRGGGLNGSCTMPGELRAQPYSARYAFYR